MKLKHNTEEIQIKSRLPVVPLRDVVVFPHMIYPLLVGRRITVNALQEAMVRDKQLLLVAQRTASTENPTAEDLHEVGVVARVLQVMKMPNGTLKVLVEGLVRADILGINKTREFFQSRVRVLAIDEQPNSKETEALSRTVSEQFAEYIRLNRRIPDEVLVAVAAIENYQQLADTIAAHILQKMDSKQRILEASSINHQFEYLSEMLREEIDILQIEQKIEGTVRESMSANQREFYLQQQLKAIKDELGQVDEPGADIDDLQVRLEEGKFPEAVRGRAEEEIRKLSRMHPYSAEATVVRAYVEWLLVLPWNEFTEDRTSFPEVKSILDGDHYGLDKPKKRIIEHLAVLRLVGKVRGPILCLVGPPGVGKTSVGRSIARAMGRKFARMSLGGIHDEAEIRGHRRTYIGAMPGRIVQALKKVQVANPVFLLDEIDKIGKDFRGDPASALLEVLDPEQNNTFSDNYLEVESDLSNILFVTTANSTAGIPAPLRDRMEIIKLPGYLEFEKVSIARDYLFPKLLGEVGLEKSVIDLRDDAILEIIRHYSREAGVRELERQLGSMLRKTAVKAAEGKRLRREVFNKTKVRKLLGAPIYTDTNIKDKPTIGYAVGLAWTEVGGDVMGVEVVPMRGKAKLTLTGSLGDVMRESGQAALSYIRNHARNFSLAEDFFDTLELHVHIPEGAVPKDGPSAGVTLLSAILSVLMEIEVRTDIAMTGEITLTGDVLAVGGLNEKLLAAKRAKVLEIIVPEKNRRDIGELPKELLEGLTLHYVRNISEVLKLALVRSPFAKVKSRPRRQPGASI